MAAILIFFILFCFARGDSSGMSTCASHRPGAKASALCASWLPHRPHPLKISLIRFLPTAAPVLHFYFFALWEEGLHLKYKRITVYYCFGLPWQTSTSSHSDSNTSKSRLLGTVRMQFILCWVNESVCWGVTLLCRAKASLDIPVNILSAPWLRRWSEGLEWMQCRGGHGGVCTKGVYKSLSNTFFISGNEMLM